MGDDHGAAAPALDTISGFEWKRPEDAELWWGWDQMHFPRPMYPYTASVECVAMSRGCTTAFQRFGMPITMHLTTLGGYGYQATEFHNLNPDNFLPKLRENIVTAVNGLMDRWQGEYLPEVMGLNAHLRDYDYAATSDEGLIAEIENSAVTRERLWDIHMQVVMPVILVAGVFGDMWEQAFGAERRFESLLLLQGFPNKTIEAGAELWKLSRLAMASPIVADIVANKPLQQIAARLTASEEGRAFRDQLYAYLEEYGWRSGAMEYADTPWIDDPAIAISTIREFMTQPDEMDPARLAERAAAERDEVLARVSAEIDALPQGPIIRSMIPWVQQYVPAQEDHNFYIDQMNSVLMRKPPLEAGRRLAAADILALADDVFLLTIDELIEALRARTVLGEARDWAELAATRREELRTQGETRPPQNAGTPLPEEIAQNPGFGGVGGFFGTPIQQDETSNVLVGTPASRGVVTARACVVMTLEDAGRLQPGDVLVCPMTMPAWTPLFAIASAVVTDTGGALSHSAIVAREYGVACVVGTTSGTRRITDGQRVTVDGTLGRVTIEAE